LTRKGRCLRWSRRKNDNVGGESSDPPPRVQPLIRYREEGVIRAVIAACLLRVAFCVKSLQRMAYFVSPCLASSPTGA
jgi:hypothetical protein